MARTALPAKANQATATGALRRHHSVPVVTAKPAFHS
jgi:hypothetical protein